MTLPPCTTRDCNGIVKRNARICETHDCRLLVAWILSGRTVHPEWGGDSKMSTYAYALMSQDESYCNGNNRCIGMLRGDVDIANGGKCVWCLKKTCCITSIAVPIIAMVYGIVWAVTEGPLAQPSN